MNKNVNLESSLESIFHKLLAIAPEFSVSTVSDRDTMLTNILTELNNATGGQSSISEYRIPREPGDSAPNFDECDMFASPNYELNCSKGDPRIIFKASIDTELGPIATKGRIEIFPYMPKGSPGLCLQLGQYSQNCRMGLPEIIAKSNEFIKNGMDDITEVNYLDMVMKTFNLPSDISSEAMWKTVSSLVFPIKGKYEGNPVILGQLELFNIPWWDGDQKLPTEVMDKLQLIVNLASLPIVNGSVAYNERKQREKAEDLNSRLEKTLYELQESQDERLKLELQLRDKNIAGGFAHEIRNGLFPAIAAMKKMNGLEGNPAVAATIMDAAQRFGDYLEQITEKASGESKKILTELCNEYQENFGSTIYFRAKDLDTAVKSSVESIEDALGVVDTIMAYAKITKPEIQEPTNIEDMVKKLYARFKPVFDQYGVQTDITTNPSSLYVHHDHVSIVFNNLVKNAIEAMKNSSQKRITISLYDKDDYTVLSVRDTGEGIKDENKKRIFDAFESSKPTTHANTGLGPNLGLGLNFIERIATVYNGKIELDSEVGKGSEFRVYFPK